MKTPNTLEIRDVDRFITEDHDSDDIEIKQACSMLRDLGFLNLADLIERNLSFTKLEQYQSASKIAESLGYDDITDLETAIDNGEIDNTEHYIHYDLIDEYYISKEYFDEYAKQEGYIPEDDALDHAVSNGEALAVTFVNERMKAFIDYWNDWQSDIDREIDCERMARNEKSNVIISLNKIDKLEENFHKILNDLE